MQRSDGSRKRARTAFNIYIRTGRRSALAEPELKFNPWHDPTNGRFTFTGGGSYYPNGYVAQDLMEADRAAGAQLVREDYGGRRRSQQRDPYVADRSDLDPRHPKNWKAYVVRQGDTLTSIAQMRRGLTAEDLAWLNEVPLDRSLQVGQLIKVPHQQYLDAGREAKRKFLALGYYARTHSGRLPSDPANPPSLESQILDSNWKKEAKNGYEFYIDVIGRSRQVYGLLHFGPSERSRKTQKGVEDRLSTDDGGHYIAVRFEGPSDAFNHFAQNANFNRGMYRAFEDKWADALRADGKVFVNIVPHYQGTSKRPDRIDVSWSVDGRKYKTIFANASKGKADGAR